jgi:hypothetical protein
MKIIPANSSGTAIPIVLSPVFLACEILRLKSMLHLLLWLGDYNLCVVRAKLNACVGCNGSADTVVIFSTFSRIQRPNNVHYLYNTVHI